MNNNPAQVAARARAERRKRLQQRQTVIFGTIIAVLLGVGLFAGAVWANIIPTPFTVEINSPVPQEVPRTAQPCPPDDAMPVPYGDMRVNVLNSTKISGLSARTASDLSAFGVAVESIGNAGDSYLGTARVVAGPEHLDAAYTVAALIPEAQIVVDTRTEDIVDVVLGSSFNDLIDADLVTLDPNEPIPAPSDCIPVEQPGDDSDGEGDDEESDDGGEA